MSDRLTPTAIAEEAYSATLNARVNRERRVGPAGIPIPLGKHVYRKAVDGPILTRIALVAFASYRRAKLPPEAWAATAASLRADLLARFPADDMRVLEKYGCASAQETAFIEILCGLYEKPEQVHLGEPILLPANAQFHVDLGGKGGSSAPPVPADTVGFFRTIVETRRERERSFDPAYHWCGVFRTQEGRWPRWQEIERQFPLIGEWMEGQRNG